MVYSRKEKCSECGDIFQCIKPMSMDYICSKCDKKQKQLKREAHFKFLDSLTVEQRLRKVEEWIYDYKPAVHPELKRF